MKIILKIWGEIFLILRKHSALIVPFLISACSYLTALYVLYLAPQRPVYYFLAPPIRKFFGDRFLHYPYNFLLLPKLFSYAEIIISALIGTVITAWIVGLIADLFLKGKIAFFSHLGKALKRYGALLVTWGISYLLVVLFSKAFIALARHVSVVPGSVLVVALFIGVVLIQMLFIYVIPLLIIEKRSLLAALKENFTVLKQLLIPTLGVILIPVLFYIPIVIFKHKLPLLVTKTFPEIVMVALASGIVCSFILEILITMSTTMLFLHLRRGGYKKKK